MKKLFVTFLFAGILSFIPSSLQSFIPSSLHPLFSSSLSAQIPSNGLVAWYPFNGNANDESGNGNHGVVNGATLTSDRFGNVNCAYNFVGANDNRIVGNFSQPLSNIHSYSFWARNNNSIIASKQWVFASGTPTIGNAVHFGVSSNIVRIGSWGTDGLGTNGSISTNWKHYVVICDNGIFSLYENGSLINEGLVKTTNIIGSSFEIGSQLGLIAESWDGLIDDLGVWSRVLSLSEIQQLYQDQTGQIQQPLTCYITTPTTTLCAGQSATLTVNTTGGAGASTQLPANLQQGLVAYYPFNGNANDESGNGNNGTVNGATLTIDRNGYSNSAYSFNGLNNFIEISNEVIPSQFADFSLSYWYLRATVTQNAESVISNRSATGYKMVSNFAMNSNTNGGVQAAICNFDNNDCRVSSASNAQAPSTSLWNQVFINFNTNSGQMYLFVNAYLIDSVSVSINNWPSYSNAISTYIGGAPNVLGDEQFFNGEIDEVLIYNRALTPSEIQQLYTAQSYAWSTNASTPTITVSPTSNTTYSCTVTQGNQTCTASVDITVNPSITHAVSATIVEGQSYTLGTQTLTTAGTYTEVFTSAAGCDSTVTVTLAVEPLLTCNITAPTTTLCAGQSATLTMNTTGGAGASSQLPANLQQGLVAYYPFNGNANDESGNNNIMQVYNCQYAIDRNGQSSSSIQTQGNNNSFLEILPSPSVNTNLFTWSLWVKFNSSAQPPWGGDINPGIISRTPYGTTCNGATIAEGLSKAGAQNLICSSVVENYGIGSDPIIGNDQWHHVVMVVNPGVQCQFFIDGLAQTPSFLPSNFTVPFDQPIRIGRPTDMYWKSYNGIFDDIAIYNRALSPSEIQQLYNAQSYAWSNNATTPTITVSPTQNTTYTCTVTQGNSTCTASVDITVNPAITNAVSATIVEGQSYTLGAQTLTTAGTYTEVFTSAAGCDSTVTLTLAVEPLLTCNITTPTTTLCAGQSATLTMNTTGGSGASSQLPANLQQGLVAYYPFNGNANDESGNGNNGTVNGATLTSDRFGNANSAYSFFGVNCCGIPDEISEIAINQPFISIAEDYSICGWMKSTDVNKYRQVVFNSINHNGFGVSLNDDNVPGRLTYGIGPENAYWDVLHLPGSTTNYVDDTWYFVSLVKSGIDYSMYLNGNLEHTVSVPNSVNYSEQVGLRFGSIGNGFENFQGDLDDFFVWNRALDVQELNQITSLNSLGNNVSFLWSTNDTPDQIVVNPLEDLTYTCTVTSGSQTCTASIDIAVNPQQTYFADADGDGYGNPNVVVQDCNVPVGYVSDNTDCNDNNAAVFAASTETCNGLDDDCDGQVDEGLTIAAVNATSVTTALYPTCSGNALKSANLNNGTNSDLIEGNGLDLWYSLTAQYNTLRASLSAAFGDNEIRLYSYNNGCFELLETEHEVYTTTSLATGNQILITDDLIPGQTYYIAVHNISGSMNLSAKMCFNHFVGTTCDHYYSNNTGIYNNVCTSFKAQYKGNATNYIFNVLSATQNNANLNITPWSYTTTTANSVVPRLGTIFPVNMSASAKVYTLRIPVIYAIPDAAGNYTSITANATTTCTVTLNPELPVALRAVDRCPNTKSTTSSISIDRTFCGALRYEWEFTQQIPSVQSPVTVLGGLNTTVFFLNNVPGMGTGKTYNVRVRPIHTNGEVGSWGTAQCLKTGTAGMVMQSENAEAWANHDSPEQEERFTLYPNPTSTGRFTLTTSNTSDDEVKNITMTDITGKVVFQTQVVMNSNAVEIEFGNLASGVYVVMVGEERMRLVVE